MHSAKETCGGRKKLRRRRIVESDSENESGIAESKKFRTYVQRKEKPFTLNPEPTRPRSKASRQGRDCQRYLECNPEDDSSTEDDILLAQLISPRKTSNDTYPNKKLKKGSECINNRTCKKVRSTYVSSISVLTERLLKKITERKRGKETSTTDQTELNMIESVSKAERRDDEADNDLAGSRNIKLKVLDKEKKKNFDMKNEESAAAVVTKLIKRGEPKESITLFREALYQKMIKRFHNNPNFSSLRSADIRYAYNLIDSIFLYGKLQKLVKEDRRRLTFRVAPRMTSRGGHLLTHSDRPRIHELAISDTLLMQSFPSQRSVTVNGIRCRDRTEAMLRIIEHEMVHLIFCCEQIPKAWRKEGPHGPMFRQAVKNLFGHKGFHHDLVTSREVAFKKIGITPGDTVSFKFKGRRLKGRVNRITKRATILVSSSGDHADSRLFSDGNHYRKFFVPIKELTLVSPA